MTYCVNMLPLYAEWSFA